MRILLFFYLFFSYTLCIGNFIYLEEYEVLLALTHAYPQKLQKLGSDPELGSYAQQVIAFQNSQDAEQDPLGLFGEVEPKPTQEETTQVLSDQQACAFAQCLSETLQNNNNSGELHLLRRNTDNTLHLDTNQENHWTIVSPRAVFILIKALKLEYLEALGKDCPYWDPVRHFVISMHLLTCYNYQIRKLEEWKQALFNAYVKRLKEDMDFIKESGNYSYDILTPLNETIERGKKEIQKGHYQPKHCSAIKRFLEAEHDLFDPQALAYSIQQLDVFSEASPSSQSLRAPLVRKATDPGPPSCPEFPALSSPPALITPQSPGTSSPVSPTNSGLKRLQARPSSRPQAIPTLKACSSPLEQRTQRGSAFYHVARPKIESLPNESPSGSPSSPAPLNARLSCTNASLESLPSLGASSMEKLPSLDVIPSYLRQSSSSRSSSAKEAQYTFNERILRRQRDSSDQPYTPKPTFTQKFFKFFKK